MSTGTRIPHAEALANAKAFGALFTGCHDRWQIAGSLRRLRPTIGDCDHVVIPKMVPTTRPTMFGEEEGPSVNAVWLRMDALIAEGKLTKARYGESVDEDTGEVIQGETTRYGEKLRGVVFEGLKHEVNMVDDRNFGSMLVIKTGPGDFGKHMVTKLKMGGRLRHDKGYVRYPDGLVRAMADEKAFFEVCGVPYMEPKDRDAFTERLKRWP